MDIGDAGGVMPTVLVVDDDRSIRHLLEKSLDSVNLVTVSRAEEGLEFGGLPTNQSAGQ